MVTQEQVEAGARALKAHADTSMYGRYITLDMCREYARIVLDATLEKEEAEDADTEEG